MQVQLMGQDQHFKKFKDDESGSLKIWNKTIIYNLFTN